MFSHFILTDQVSTDQLYIHLLTSAVYSSLLAIPKWYLWNQVTSQLNTDES